MRLSMRDWRLLLLVAGTLIFARLSGGRLPFFLFYLSAGLLMVGYLWTRHALHRLECLIQVDSDHTEVGQKLLVKVRLDNDAIVPLPWVEVDDATPPHLVASDLPQQATSVPLWGSRIANIQLTAVRRGHYRVGPIRVTLGDALGLFRGRKEFHSRSTVTVYPHIHQIEGLPVPLSQPFGPVRTRERAFEDPSNQAEIRKYRPGDNPRHIHWKTSARMGELMLREYELNATTQMMLLPDMCQNVQVIQDKVNGFSTEETAVELSASLALLGLQRKIDVGLVCHAQERFAVPAGRGNRTFHEILEVLARTESLGKIPIEQVLSLETAHLSSRCTLVVITPSLSPQLADMLIRLRSNHQVMLVLLRRESFIPHTNTAEDEVAPAAEAASQYISPLHALLELHKVAVYLVSAGDDLRRLADLRLVASHEGVRAWPHGAQPSVTR